MNYEQLTKLKKEINDQMNDRSTLVTMEDVADMIMNEKKEGIPDWKDKLDIFSKGSFQCKYGWPDRFYMPSTYLCMQKDKSTPKLLRTYRGTNAFDEIRFDMHKNTWSKIEIGYAMR